MSQPTHSLKEFFANTTIIAVDGRVANRGDPVPAPTATKPFELVKVDLAQRDVLPKGYVTIDDLINEAEQEDKTGIEEARRWVGKAFYKGDRSLRTIRLKRGLSQSRLAAAIGTTQAHIARIENGSDVQMSTLTRIASALRTPDLKVVEAYLVARRASGVLQE